MTSSLSLIKSFAATSGDRLLRYKVDIDAGARLAMSAARRNVTYAVTGITLVSGQAGSVVFTSTGGKSKRVTLGAPGVKISGTLCQGSRGEGISIQTGGGSVSLVLDLAELPGIKNISPARLGALVAFASREDASPPASPPSAGPGGHPALAKGVNMFDWFMGPNIYSSGHQAGYISDYGLSDLKAKGFTHVRLPVYGKFIANVDGATAVLDSTRMAALDSAISRVVSKGLTVVLAMFPEDDMWRLANDATAQQTYASLWAQLAARYSGYPTDRLYLELINEPHFQFLLPDVPSAKLSFETLRSGLISAIRDVTPYHYLIVSGYDFCSVQDVIDYNSLVSDSRVIYTAHYYEPIAFTYQGVDDFPDPTVQALFNIPYPVRQPLCDTNIAALPDDIEAQMTWYCPTNFNATTINNQFASFKSWADSHGVSIYLGEFGAGRNHSIPGDAEQWIHDVRTAAQSRGINWSYWSYWGEFGLCQSGNFVQSVLDALFV